MSAGNLKQLLAKMFMLLRAAQEKALKMASGEKYIPQ